MKKLMVFVVLLMLLAVTGLAAAQSMEPTQTPYIIYVVVTATPQPEPDEAITIQRTTGSSDEISLVNGGSAGAITLSNPTETTGSYASSAEELVQNVVATVMAQVNTSAGGNGTAVIQNGSSAVSGSGAVVRNSDGTTCTMSFDLVSEPTYPAGSIIPRGAVFWKEWVIRNTGTCTWTPAWSFVFSSGWQIGNTRFSMNRTTAPGETLTVRLGMRPDQPQNGNYYSTYAFEAPDGTQFGTITSSYTVKDPAYFTPKPTIPPGYYKPQHGSPAKPEPPCPPYWPCWPWPYYP